MKKISTIFLLVITASFFAGGIKIQAQDLINFNGWEFLSWKTDKKNVEKILKDKKIELAKTAELYTWFKYQEMNTWLNYDNNNQLNKILQRNTFSIIEYDKANKFFEKTIARLTKTYGKPNHTKINKQDSVKTFIWELKYTRIELEYDYMYKIIDEFGAGSYWVEVNISPDKFESDLVNPEKESPEQFIFGKWKLDYKSTKDFYGNIMTENDKKENTLEFSENGNYKRFIWGFESGGTFMVAKNELRLNEKYRIGDKEGSERGKYLLKIEKFKKNKLIISFTECDVKVYQVYQKIKRTVYDYEGYNDVKEIIEAFKSADTKIIKSISTDKGYVNLLKIIPAHQQKDAFFKQTANDLSIATFSIGISMEMIDHHFFETENKRIELLIISLKDGHKLFDLKIEKTSNNMIKTGTEFEKADDLLVKYGAEKNVFSRKFTKPSVSYMLPNNVGIIIIYNKKAGKNVIVELLKCNNPEAEKDIREWKNVEQIELIEKNRFNQK